MKLLENIKMAVKALVSNRMRSVLTMLGVIIGVFAVITLISMGEAAKAFIYKQISSFGEGVNYLETRPWEEGSGAMGSFGSMLDSKLTYKDAMAIQDKSTTIRYIDPRTYRPGEIHYGRKSHKVPFIFGVSAYYPYVFTHGVKEGRFFNDAEVGERRKVVVIGSKASEALFGGLSPIGERIKIKGGNFTVVGLFENKGSFFGFDYDDIVAIPVTTAQQIFDSKTILEIGVLVKDEALVDKAKMEIENILFERHGKKDFKTDTQKESLDLLNTILGALTGIIGGIAAISLLVGSIGIMNIMLVSVTERIKEIGIRKAIGAKKSDIFFQFLVESTIISFGGGLIGILLGSVVSLIIMYFMGVPLAISPWAITLACSVSVAIGIFSGVYPAMRAANLNPVEALRSE